MRPDVLDLIVEKYAKRVADFELEEPLAGPASADDLRQVQLDAREALGADLDPAYLYLASVADGIGADGISVYAVRRPPSVGATSEWIIRENLDYRQHGVGSTDAGSDPNDWLIYAAGGSEFILEHLPTRRFQLRRRANTSHATYDFGTFEELLWEVFRCSLELGHYPDGDPA